MKKNKIKKMTPRRTSRNSNPQLIEAEGAAAEIEDVALFFQPLAEGRDDGVFAPRAVGVHVHNACLLEDAEMFGNVVLRESEFLGEIVDAVTLVEQALQDPHP